MTFGVAVLLPHTLFRAFLKREGIARGVILVAILVHVASSAAGGKWGAQVDVSRDLLRYARQHEGKVYLTDVGTMNEMYVINGFRFPTNVVCLNGPAVRKHLRVNFEPPDVPRFSFPDITPDYLLINLDRRWEKDFERYLLEHTADRMQIVAVRYRPIFLPLIPFLGPKGYMVKSLGGEVAEVKR